MDQSAQLDQALLARIPINARHVLEAGYGSGRLGAAFRRRQPFVRYVGVELPDLEGGPILPALSELPQGQGFDTLIFDGTLEAYRDPARVLALLSGLVTDDAVCIASITNAAHWSTFARFVEHQRSPAVGRTGLPAFTRATASELFQRAGWTVIDTHPCIEQTEAAVGKYAPMAESLGVTPERLRYEISARSWVIRATRSPPAAPVHLVGLGLKKVAGVTEARIDHPLAALASLPSARAAWAAGGVAIPRAFKPGIFIVQRQFLDDAAFNAGLDNLIAAGWTLISEIDDDPHHWDRFVANGFHAFRGVHAVTTTTEKLAAMLRQWNPNVGVFPNAIFELPAPSPRPDARGGRLRIFFGALNRAADWAAIRIGVLAAAEQLGDAIEFVVVHDREVFDSLPAATRKEFHPTQPPDRYMALLASCDIALLPLGDTPFNRLKSDLKFIECCAAGAVPIASPLLYADQPEHHDIGIFARTAQDWQDALETLCGTPGDLAARRERGLAYVKASRMHSQQVAARETFYWDLIDRREELEAQRQARLRR